ncbi:MAG: flagellar biosynthetic protein FliQ [Planctomycetota bacterium]
MDTSLVVDLSRETLLVAMKIITPALAIGMLVGLIVSFLQTITSIQEQTLSLVPKMLAVALTLLLLLPWVLRTLLDFSSGLFRNLGLYAGLVA